MSSSSISDASQGPGYRQLPAGEITQNFTTKDNRRLTISSLTKVDSKAINSTLKEWVNIVEDRLGQTRVQNSTQKSEESKKFLEEDMKTKNDYKELISRFNEVLKSSEDYQFKVLRDEDNNIQALCAYKITGDEVYLGHLFTAPWNLKMHGNIQDIHKKLLTKGCGTLLLVNCCQEGQKAGKHGLRLKPLEGSFSYYHDYLKMEHDKERDEFVYKLDSSDIPETLRKRLFEVFS